MAALHSQPHQCVPSAEAIPTPFQQPLASSFACLPSWRGGSPTIEGVAAPPSRPVSLQGGEADRSKGYTTPSFRGCSGCIPRLRHCPPRSSLGDSGSVRDTSWDDSWKDVAGVCRVVNAVSKPNKSSPTHTSQNEQLYYPKRHAIGPSPAPCKTVGCWHCTTMASQHLPFSLATLLLSQGTSQLHSELVPQHLPNCVRPGVCIELLEDDTSAVNSC